MYVYILYIYIYIYIYIYMNVCMHVSQWVKLILTLV